MILNHGSTVITKPLNLKAVSWKVMEVTALLSLEAPENESLFLKLVKLDPQIWQSVSTWYRTMVRVGHFKNTHEILYLRALKILMLYKNHIFQCMGNIFCVTANGNLWTALHFLQIYVNLLCILHQLTISQILWNSTILCLGSLLINMPP